jgi:uncharacterized protein
MKRLVCCVWLLFVASALHAQTAAQAPLPTTQLSVNGKSITAEVADDDAERETGLMFREKLAPNSGMLFVMPRPDYVSFWMHNTLIPLSIAYINPSGMILEIHSMKAKDDTPIRSVFPSVAYALEMEDGWFDKNGVLPGDRLQGLPPVGKESSLH